MINFFLSNLNQPERCAAYAGIHTYTYLIFPLQKSITRQFADPLEKKITLSLFFLNKLHYHLLECIMCPRLLSWLALCSHDNLCGK